MKTPHGIFYLFLMAGLLASWSEVAWAQTPTVNVIVTRYGQEDIEVRVRPWRLEMKKSRKFEVHVTGDLKRIGSIRINNDTKAENCDLQTVVGIPPTSHGKVILEVKTESNRPSQPVWCSYNIDLDISDQDKQGGSYAYTIRVDPDYRIDPRD